MRIWLVLLCLLGVSLIASGQAATGTITGTVSDPAGAVIAGANVEAKNTATGVVYPVATSATGNYTITQLPIGTYEITVRQQGFKTFTHTNLTVPAGATIKEDVGLEVGTATEAITVNEEATLLALESAETAHNVTLSQLDNLPLLGIGAANAGTAGIRNPFAMTQLLPGTTFGSPTGAGATNTVIVNGLQNNSEGVRVEGQDSRNNTPGVSATAVRQPSADAVQEVSVQTSNYAPEFGTAGGGVYNIIMKSGTNDFHGSGYEYFVNEDLNAAGSFSSNGAGGKYRPRNRRNDYGGTFGGPVWIPKLYNGHNRTFFFFSWEQYRENTQLTFNDTVPTQAYLNGDFSAISPNGTCSLCSQYGIQKTPLGIPTAVTDPVGQPIFANEIFDPLSRTVNPANGLSYASPFPNNMVPASRFSPTAVAMQKLFPAPSNSNLTQNYIGDVPSIRITTIPSVKIDESVSSKDKFAFYYSTTGTASAVSTPLGDADGLPLEIGQYRGTYIDSKTVRLNYDRTITPTLLLHVGAGWQRVNFLDHAPFLSFDPSQFDLSGFEIHRQFPSVTGMCAQATTTAIPIPCVGAGGMQVIGTASQTQSATYFQKPTYNANMTWVRGNHTFKAGGELSQMGAVTQPFAGVTLATGTGPTSEPFTPTNSLNGYSMGFGYASFLLGDFTSTTQTPGEDYRPGHLAWAFFLQDSWKVTRKLTLDYGLRYDYGTPIEEEHGRSAQFDPTTPNQNAGGHPGSVEFANTCQCSFYRSAYPLALGPRLGVAYQLDSKTVIRGGWGFVYQYPTDDPVPTIGTSAVNAPTGINAFVNINSPNPILPPTWPATNPFVYPAPGVALGLSTNVPDNPDRNYNRPPRQNQFSIGIQREITRNFLMEAAYVANRDVWLNGTVAGTPGYLSQLPASLFSQYGLYPYPGTGPSGYTVAQNYADYQLLTQPINSTAVMTRMKAAGVGNGGLLLPYSGFPLTNSLLSALYPFPQYGALAVAEAPTGGSKYDSLQMKATKRFSHGLQAAGAFTWEKSFVRADRQDFFNPQSSVWNLQQVPPLQLTFNVTYTTPSVSILNKYANLLIKDWQIGAFALYQSAPFLTPPTNPITNFLPSEEYRVPGQPLYLVNVNNNANINPYTQQVLNPAAWSEVPAGGVGPAPGVAGGPPGTLYSDFRGPRRPVENANLGRNFRVHEKYNLQIRAEFTNIFNRTFLPPPSTAVAPQVALTKNSLGQYTAGFGIMNATAAVNTVPTLNGASRAGTLIARFTF